MLRDIKPNETGASRSELPATGRASLRTHVFACRWANGSGCQISATISAAGLPSSADWDYLSPAHHQAFRHESVSV